MPKFQRWKGIQKCYPFEEKRLATWTPPYICQPKYDGNRCVDIPLDYGNHLLLISEENPFFSVPHINQALIELNLPMRLDGELYNHEIFLEGGHELIHSIVSRTVNTHPRYKEIQFIIFDYQDDLEPQWKRMLNLHELRGRFKPPLILAPYWMCETLDEIKEVYDKLIELKYEGIIVRNTASIYEINKRSRWIMKFKPKKKDVYKIVGWKEEVSMDGVPKGRIGSLIMSSQVGDEFGVSAGLDFEEKDRLWNIRDQLAGMMAMVHYQHLTNKQIPKGTFNVEVLRRKNEVNKNK